MGCGVLSLKCSCQFWKSRCVRGCVLLLHIRCRRWPEGRRIDRAEVKVNWRNIKTWVIHTILVFPPAWSQWLRMNVSNSRNSMPGSEPYWWVFMIAVRFIFPESICSFKTGTTLYEIFNIMPTKRTDETILRWVCGINDHRVFWLVINDKIGVVIARPHPYPESKV